MDDELVLGESTDPNGVRVVLLERVWTSKVLANHPEMEGQLDPTLRAVATPDHIAADPVHALRRRYYRQNTGPSRWLLVVVSYEQEPARIISAFGNRKDPRSWSR